MMIERQCQMKNGSPLVNSPDFMKGRIANHRIECSILRESQARIGEVCTARSRSDGSQDAPPPWTGGARESFELLRNLPEPSCRRKTVSSLFNIFWTPAFAGVI
jgi:hypothetical protein